MRKTLLTCLILMAIGLGLFVSCNAESAIPEEKDGIAYIRFGENGVRSFDATYDIADYDDLYWFYTATKKDNYGTTGVTTSETAVTTETNADSNTVPQKGLGGEVGPFSQGEWEFTLAAYSALNDDKTPNQDTKVYATKSAIAVTLLGGQTKSIPASVKAVGESGSIKFSEAFFKWKGDGTATSEAPEFTITMAGPNGKTYTLTTDSTKIASGNTDSSTTKQIILGSYDSENKGFPIKFVVSDNTETGGKTYSDTLDGIDVDYYGVIVSAYISGNESNPLAQDTTAFRVYGGATTVISGDLTENPTQKVKFDVAKTEIVTQLTASRGATTVTANSVPDTTEISGTTKNTTIEFAEGILATSSTDNSTVSVVVLVEASNAESASQTFTIADSTDTSGGNVVVYDSIKIEATEITTTTSSTTTREIKNFNESVTEENQKKWVTVKTYVSTGLNGNTDYDASSSDSNTCNLVLYYNGKAEDASSSKITKYTATTGYLEFQTTHFSEFYLASKEKGSFYSSSKNRYYLTLKEAVAAASDISLKADASLSEAVAISSAVTLDLNGNTLTVSKAAAFNVTSSLVVRNGNIKTAEGSPISATLFNVSGNGSLTLDRVSADCDAKIDDTYYYTLKEAIDAASSGDTVTLLRDVTSLSETLTVTKNLTLNLGGNTIKSSQRVFHVKNGTLTVKNGTIESSPSNTGDAVIKLSINDEQKDETVSNLGLILEKDAIINGLTCYGISAWGRYDAVLNIYGTINSANACVSGNGTKPSDKNEGKVTINIYEGAKLTAYGQKLKDTDGVISADSENTYDACGIYQPNVGGVLNIEGGTITSKTYSAVEVRNGVANIKGGTLTSNAESFVSYYRPRNDLSGPTTKGAAVAVNYYGTAVEEGTTGVTVNISGGTFNALKSLAIVKVNNIDYGEATVKTVVKGITLADEDVFTDGFEAKVSTTDADTYYITFEKAVENAPEGSTITLLRDLNLTSSYKKGDAHPLSFSENVTVDLSQHTISTNNYGVYWEGNGLTIKNGTFKSVDTEVAQNNGIGSYALFFGLNDHNSNRADSNYTATIDNVTCEGGIDVCSHNLVVKNSTIKGTNFYALWAENGGVITVESGTFTNGKVSVLNTGSNESDGGNECPKGDIVVKGGTFTSTGTIPVIKDKSHVKISGGSFSEKPSSSYLEEGYTATNNNGTWIVAKNN